jgi:hypothetical protein
MLVHVVDVHRDRRQVAPCVAEEEQRDDAEPAEVVPFAAAAR